MGTLEPIALSPRNAAQFLSISKRTMSRLISSRKIVARKDGKRTLVDVASLKAYYASLPLKTGFVPLVFVHPITGRRHRSRRASH
ncbi:MAG TPA: helix-turn-helix domain-containing protein [Pirellulales bacterium]|jgi:excisionase family DNA binding protein